MRSNWRGDWNSISYRIQGVAKAASFLLNSIPAAGGDAYDAGHNFVLTNALGVLETLNQYVATFRKDLPPSALAAMERFLTETKAMHVGLPPKGLPGLQVTVTALTSFDAEFSHLIVDHDAVARHLTSRAFIHLQRLLVVDAEVSARWKKAFAEGETACEKLGAIQLLHHGIWAIKANAEGARTDLVLGTPLVVTRSVHESSEAMVLTEWKLVKTPAEVEKQSNQARAQMSQYSDGVLAGFELASMRYAVLVSLDAIDLPPDEITPTTIYRHVNIAIAPSVPSKCTVFRDT